MRQIFSLLLLLSFTLAGVAFTSQSVQAQAVTVGTYSFYFTDTNNNQISSATIVSGQTLSVRLFIRETGGNVFSGTRTASSGAFAGQVVGGISGFDSIFSVAGGGGTSVVRLEPPANPTPGLRYFGVTASPQFGGSAGGYFEENVQPFNETGTAPSFAQPVANTAQPSTYVRDTVSPNTPGNIFLYEIDFQTGFAGSTAGTTTLTAGQGNGSNFLYRDAASTLTALDPVIGTATGALSITVVPVPEPTTVFGLSTLGLLAAGYVRRQLAC